MEKSINPNLSLPSPTQDQPLKRFNGALDTEYETNQMGGNMSSTFQYQRPLCREYIDNISSYYMLRLLDENKMWLWLPRWKRYLYRKFSNDSLEQISKNLFHFSWTRRSYIPPVSWQSFPIFSCAFVIESSFCDVKGCDFRFQITSYSKEFCCFLCFGETATTEDQSESDLSQSSARFLGWFLGLQQLGEYMK